jgi:glutamate synthase domain-containing protein 2
MFYQKVISVFCQEADSCHLINCPAEIAEIAEILSNKYIVSSLAAVTLLIIQLSLALLAQSH